VRVLEFEEERICGFRPTVSRRLASPGVPLQLRRRTDDFRKNGHLLKYSSRNGITSTINTRKNHAKRHFVRSYFLKCRMALNENGTFITTFPNFVPFIRPHAPPRRTLKLSCYASWGRRPRLFTSDTTFPFRTLSRPAHHLFHHTP
jgi:hypothetical protein